MTLPMGLRNTGLPKHTAHRFISYQMEGSLTFYDIY